MTSFELDHVSHSQIVSSAMHPLHSFIDMMNPSPNGSADLLPPFVDLGGPQRLQI